jgi:transposase
MPAIDDLSRSLIALDLDSTLMTVIEMSQASWLVAGMLPGVQRHPLKKLDPDPNALFRSLTRWRSETEAAGMSIDRVAGLRSWTGRLLAG